MRRMMDLPGWPPNIGSAWELYPPAADQVTIGQVLKVMPNRVEFTCKFGVRSVFCSFQKLDEKTGQEIAAILRDNTGKILLSIGSVEILSD